MTPRDDFSPIAEQGELPPSSGLRLTRRRPDLGQVEAGFVRMLIGQDGSMFPEHQRTGGERQWGRMRSWIKIDVGDHMLEYEVPFYDPSGRFKLKAHVSVRASVSDPTEAAARGVKSVRNDLESAVRQVIFDATDEAESVEGGTPIAALNESRRRAEISIRRFARGNVPGLPGWLNAVFGAVSVSLDGKTQDHLDNLVGTSFESEMLDASRINTEKKVRGEVAVRAIWRDELLPHLSNPAARLFEAAFADPSQANIARAVDQVAASDMRAMLEGFELLRTMVDKDHVDKGDPFYTAIEAMCGRMAHVYMPGAAAALGGPAAKEELPVGDDPAEHVIDHEPSDVDAEEGDSDWGKS